MAFTVLIDACILKCFLWLVVMLILLWSSERNHKKHLEEIGNCSTFWGLKVTLNLVVTKTLKYYKGWVIIFQGWRQASLNNLLVVFEVIFADAPAASKILLISKMVKKHG